MSNQASLGDISGNSSSRDEDSQTKESIRNGPIEFPKTEEWDIEELQDVAGDVDHPIVDGPFGSQMKVEDFSDSGKVPILEMEHLQGWGFSREDLTRFIDEEKYQEVKRSRVRPRDVVMSKTGTIGAVDIVGKDIKNAVITSRLAKITPDPSELNSKYTSYWVDFLRRKGYWESVATGTTMLVLNLGQIRGTKISVPEKDEQRRIASVLYNVDHAISKTEEIIEQTQRVKKGAIQESLHKEMNQYEKPTDWGSLFSDWEEKELDEVCSLITDGSHNPPKRVDEGIPIVGVEELRNGILDFSEELSYISEDDYESMSDTNKPIKGDVLVAVVGATIGKSASVQKDREFAIQRSLGLLRPKKDLILSDFLKIVLQSPSFKRQLDSRSRATAQAGVYLEELRRINVPVPPIETQKEIIERIESISEYIRKNEDQLSCLKSLKKGLMQDLLTGEVRTGEDVRVLDEVVEVEG